MMVCLAVAAGGATCAQAQYAQRPPRSSQEARSPQAVSAELIRLHDDLRLTESQETAWRDYTAAIAPDPQTVARHRATSELLPLVPTPRRIALIEATMAQDAKDFRKQGEAVTAFYGSLTLEQQKTFDRDTLPASEGDERP
jgi:periplasmic protein CpxP/Spy